MGAKIKGRREISAFNTGRPAFPAHDAAAQSLYMRFVHTFMRAINPVLAQIASQDVDHLPEGSAPSSVVTGTRSAPMEVCAEGSLSASAMVLGDDDAWILSSLLLAEDALKNFMPQFYEAVDQSAGVKVDARGKPISHDLMLDMFEQMDITIGEDGNPVGLSLVGGTGFVDSIAKLPPMTEEQEARWIRIMAKKKVAQDARKRVRKLD